MKKLNALNKLVFICNSVFALLLLFSYALPFVFPKKFPLLSVLSLTLPVLIIINLFFLIYWLLGLKRQFLLSLIVLLLGYSHVTSFYKFSGTENSPEEGLKVMTYNVRMFNLYKWIDDDSIETKIIDLIKKESPDILCLQDFERAREGAFPDYKYHYFKYKTDKSIMGQAIFSKYPIISKGSLDFVSQGNNAIYADVVAGEDTIRVYNLHLESHKINPADEQLTKENSERLYKRLANTFGSQQTQAETFDEHQKLCPYEKIVCGDFNNTSSSNVYKIIRGDMNDTFEEQGEGFGTTFNFRYFPVRIDFILTDRSIEVLSHKNFDQKYSDHFPVQADLKL